MNSHRIPLALTALLFGFAASAQNHVLDQAVATELIRGATGNLAIGALQNDPEFARLYTSSVLEQELAQEAARRGLAERLDVQRALSMSRFQILIQALQADIARQIVQPTEADVKAYFEKNRATMILKEAVKADVFLLDGTDTSAIEIARASVATQTISPEELQKTRFKQIALAEQVWVAREVFPEDVWKEIRLLPKGKVRFYKVEDNFLLLKYEDYRAERPATLEDVQDDIRNQLRNERQQAAWNAFVEKTGKSIGLTP